MKVLMNTDLCSILKKVNKINELKTNKRYCLSLQEFNILYVLNVESEDFSITTLTFDLIPPVPLKFRNQVDQTLVLNFSISSSWCRHKVKGNVFLLSNWS